MSKRSTPTSSPIVIPRPSTPDSDPITACTTLCKTGNTKGIKNLLEKGKLSPQEAFGIAVKVGSPTSMEYLLDEYVTPSPSTDSIGGGVNLEPSEKKRKFSLGKRGSHILKDIAKQDSLETLVIYSKHLGNDELNNLIEQFPKAPNRELPPKIKSFLEKAHNLLTSPNPLALPELKGAKELNCIAKTCRNIFKNLHDNGHFPHNTTLEILRKLTGVEQLTEDYVTKTFLLPQKGEKRQDISPLRKQLAWVAFVEQNNTPKEKSSPQNHL